MVALPDTLSEAYNQIYDAVLAQNGGAYQIALNAFRWIKCSYEPLKSETLLNAIIAEVGRSVFYVLNLLFVTRYMQPIGPWQ